MAPFAHPTTPSTGAALLRLAATPAPGVAAFESKDSDPCARDTQAKAITCDATRTSCHDGNRSRQPAGKHGHRRASRLSSNADGLPFPLLLPTRSRCTVRVPGVCFLISIVKDTTHTLGHGFSAFANHSCAGLPVHESKGHEIYAKRVIRSRWGHPTQIFSICWPMPNHLSLARGSRSKPIRLAGFVNCAAGEGRGCLNAPLYQQTEDGWRWGKRWACMFTTP